MCFLFFPGRCPLSPSAFHLRSWPHRQHPSGGPRRHSSQLYKVGVRNKLWITSGKTNYPLPQSSMSPLRPPSPQNPKTRQTDLSSSPGHGPTVSTPVDAPTAQSFMSPGPRHPAPFTDSANSDLSSGPPSSHVAVPPLLEDLPFQQLPEAGKATVP